MTVGEKIRKYRIEAGYTQRELARMSRLSESAIRNYELGNRTPSPEQIEKIAASLKINPFAISDPDFTSYVGTMHALYELEEKYGLHAYIEGGVAHLSFKNKGWDSLHMSEEIHNWAEMYEKLRKEEISEEEYLEWKNTYPRSTVLNKSI